jgi:dTDP-4-dehydrorhamnose 3,5-epimerase
MGVKITKLDIDGLLLIEPDYFYDNRGYYSETFSLRSLKENGFIPPSFVQEGESLTLKKGTLRGIHFQKYPYAQAKLVRCTHGKILDVAVDLRKNSKTFGKFIMIELSEENKKQLFIPQGFGHAFMSLEDNSILQYKVDNFYFKEYEGSVRYNDPQINIPWPIKDPLTSDKDKVAPLLKDAYLFEVVVK